MKAAIGASPPSPMVTPNLCPHLLDAAQDIDHQPLALYLTRRRSDYLCPHCLGEVIEKRLAMATEDGATVAAQVHFVQCEHDHAGSPDRRFCYVCLEAASGDLLTRWARVFFRDKTLANRLRRIVNGWRRYYDLHNIREKAKPRAARKTPPRKDSREQHRILAAS